MDKYRVSLTAEERADLEGMVSAGTASARKLTHARVLLLADACAEEWPDDDIVEALSVGQRTIARVRKQFVTEGFEAALLRKQQPPRPDKIKIKGDVEQELVRLACCDPPEGRCRWTLRLLADELVALGRARSRSTETVRQALKKTTSSRGSSRPGAYLRTPTASTSGTWRT
jgi:Homeodomain-like domain